MSDRRLVTIHPTVSLPELAAVLTTLADLYGRLKTKANADGLVVYIDAWHQKAAR